jgi:glycosyltransferase involved in cell wall biosynthesis
MQAQFTILLPTFNGAPFLPELLDSCLQWPEVALFARDDGSRDGTRDLLRGYENKHPGRVRLAAGKNLGVKANVAWLLERLDSPYFLLADQDDIWERDKLPKLHSAMHTLEQRHGKDTPLLVWSDACLVDGQGKVLHPSLFAATGLPASWCGEFRHSLVISNAAGCTMLGNLALARAAVPIPSATYMHDWWILLVAQALGHTSVVDEALVRYRQHRGNLLGAGTGWKALCAKARNGLAASRRKLASTQLQAQELLQRHGHAMDREKRELCRAWAAMPGLSRHARIRTCLDLGFEKPGLLRCLAFWACLTGSEKVL